MDDTWDDYNAAVANGLSIKAGQIKRRLEHIEREHPHEHTTHTLRDVIEALPRYSAQDKGEALTAHPSGEWLKLSDVRAVVHKAAVLGAPVADND